MNDQRHYTAFAAAFLRGSHRSFREIEDDATVVDSGRRQGWKLHPFKRTAGLPRVRAVLGRLKGVQPGNLLDIGSGRGVFLWPLLEAFPALDVTAVENSRDRVRFLEATRDGGLDRLHPVLGDVTALDFPDHCFDIVTCLEVLEHLQDPLAAAREVCRVARRFVLASVPSKADDNPQHIQLFSRTTLQALFAAAGAVNVKVDYVLNHMICVARLNDA